MKRIRISGELPKIKYFLEEIIVELYYSTEIRCTIGTYVPRQDICGSLLSSCNRTLCLPQSQSWESTRSGNKE